jgi:hypothetical protein
VLTRSVALGAFVATAIFPAAVISLNLIQAGRHDSLRQLASVIRCSPSRGGGPPICFGDLRNRSQRHSHMTTHGPSLLLFIESSYAKIARRQEKQGCWHRWCSTNVTSDAIE